jgi:hypothetical protein
MVFVSTALTTDRVRELAAQGKTVASGSTVMSTRDSANAAYLAAINRVRVTNEFKAAQTQTARQASQERTAQMQSVADNSTNLPNFDSQNQIYNSSRNNVVNPSSIFPSQPVITNGQGQNSTLKYGINTNANFNTATAMNDFTSANPTLEINLGQTVNPAYFTAGKSSIPYNNDTNTDLLGGDIQHQETEINTNLEYEKPLSQQSQANVNWAQSINYSAFLIPIAAIGGLYFMGKRK